MYTVYKLLLPNSEGDLVSISAWGRYEVVYPPGVKIEHPNLFIFGKLADALMFRTESIQLWRAETPSARRAPARVLASSALPSYYTVFWHMGADRVPADKLAAPFPGSMLCDELTLINQVL